MTDNPYLNPESPFEAYKSSVEALKGEKEYIEFDRLCYMVFSTPDGKMLTEEISKRFIEQGFVNPSAPQAANVAIYYEGFKEAFRMFNRCIQAHKQRIEAENKKSRGNG